MECFSLCLFHCSLISLLGIFFFVVPSYAGQSSGVCLASIFESELEYCKHGLDPTLCLDSLEFESSTVQVIRSSIGFSSIDMPQTDQGVQELFLIVSFFILSRLLYGLQ